MRTKIYTKGGDQGQTSVIGGSRVSKAEVRLDAYGTIDELNAIIGLALSALTTVPSSHYRDDLNLVLSSIQNELFVVGSHLACVDDKLREQLPPLKTESTLLLEKSIDSMTSELPELRDFILPGGHTAASCLHLARTVCRRAERIIVLLFESKEQSAVVQATIIVYINRLSDYLFTAARFVNYLTQTPETKWKK